MAKKKGVRVILLVEDETLERFARTVLRYLGFSKHELRPCPFPVGKNAKQWVTQDYPNQVQAQRREANHQRIALLVGTDADELTVQKRCDALAVSLSAANVLKRKVDECIVLWIPKWHVETWILHLSRVHVNENQSYKHEAKAKVPDFDEIGREFVRLFRESQENWAASVLPSLKVAFQETKRLGL